MEWRSYSRRNLTRSTGTGLAAGIILGLIEASIMVIINLMRPPLAAMVLLLVVYGVLGLLSGLGLGVLRVLWRARQERDIGPTEGKPIRLHTHDVERSHKQRWSHLGQNLVQGVGAGLIAGGVVGLVEVVGLVIVDVSWQPVTGLLYAVVVYGVLGLLGGLGLGLLRGLWVAWRDRDGGRLGHPAWITLGTLIAASGTFVVVHNRVRRDIMSIHAHLPTPIEEVIVDNALLALVAVLAVGLWFLLCQLPQRTRLMRFRWSVTLYVALVLVAVLISGVAGLIAASEPIRPAPAAAGTLRAPDLRDKPNVLFIVAETLRADRLGCYGSDDNLTPRLDALARDGVLYHQMSVQASWTRPSVATMLTSLYPSSHGAVRRDMILPDDAVTLPEILSAAGYRTGGFTTNVQTAHHFNFQQGYDTYAFPGPDLPFFAFGTPVSTRFATYAVFVRLYRIFQPAISPPYQDAASFNQYALAWIEAHRDRRFFLFLHYMDPHDPYFAHPYDGRNVSSLATPNPDPAQTSYILELYNGEVAFLDHHLGEFFDQLKAWGLYDDMLIVFTADHGEEFYEHTGWWHSYTLYEEVLAVPLIIKYPGNAHAGTVDEEFACSLDIAPTVLDATRLPIPEAMQGVSLRPGAAVTRAEFLFSELDNIGTVRAIRNHRYKLVVADEDNPRDLPTEALFDLQTDPGEQKNLAQDQPDMVRLLRAELDRVMAFAETHAVAGQSRELDAVTRERLRQLGY